MTDAGSDSRSHLRLSDSEREDAVARLQANAAEGRLNAAELAERSAAVRAAVTHGDLSPVFSDLPPTPLAPAAAYPPAAAPAAPAAWSAEPPVKPAATDLPRPVPRGSSGVLVVSVAPFVALVLFFATAHFFGYEFAWLWFLLVPLVGILVYGTGARDRYRD